MAASLALIILLGLLSAHLLKRIGLPGLIGMLLAGIALGPHALDVIDPDLLGVSADFRMIALIVILLRAGLKIRKDTINRVGKTAMLLSFAPSTVEGLAVTAAAPLFFNMSLLESAMLGFIIAAVSPAVVVPSMIRFMDKGRGTEKGIPTLMLASSSLDNAFVIVVFSTVLGMCPAQDINPFVRLLDIPASIVLGVGTGIAAGFLLDYLFKKHRPRHTKKAMVVIGAGVLLIWLENALRGLLPFSGLLGVMAIGFILLEKSEETAHAVSAKLSKIWVFAEILLFVLVGAQVNVHVAWEAGLGGAALVLIGLAARSATAYVSVSGAGFTKKEKLFCVVSYVPKATVQAAIGAMPLSAGVKGGEVILAVAVLSILITAPLGAVGIDVSGRRFLRKEGRRRKAPETG